MGLTNYDKLKSCWYAILGIAAGLALFIIVTVIVLIQVYLGG